MPDGGVHQDWRCGLELVIRGTHGAVGYVGQPTATHPSPRLSRASTSKGLAGLNDLGCLSCVDPGCVSFC